VKPLTIFLAIFCQFFLVAGQIFFKRAMRQTPEPRPKEEVFIELGLGVLAMSVWFFIWIGLLENENLSRVFPFEGLNPVLMVVAAWLLLKERVTWNTGVGILLICAGIFLASTAPKLTTPTAVPSIAQADPGR
jgi:drug/metabolite transporter (DMT)-like permease